MRCREFLKAMAISSSRRDFARKLFSQLSKIPAMLARFIADCVLFN